MNVVPMQSTAYYYQSNAELIAEKQKLQRQIDLIDKILDANYQIDNHSATLRGCVIL